MTFNEIELRTNQTIAYFPEGPNATEYEEVLFSLVCSISSLLSLEATEDAEKILEILEQWCSDLEQNPAPYHPEHFSAHVKVVKRLVQAGAYEFPIWWPL